MLGAWLTGARVVRVVLHPLSISRTDVSENQRPLLVVWAGPIVGSALPPLFWWFSTRFWRRTAFLWRFFAGFCLVANGAYIGLGSFARVGDCGDMLRHGSPIGWLWLFGAAAMPLGLWLCHGQGVHFGFGAAHGVVDYGAARLALAVAALLVAVGWVIGG